MKFAFMLLGPFHAQKDHTRLPSGDVQVFGVSSIQEACLTAQRLCQEGIDCIELCGAFEEAGARQVIEATGGKVPVGFVVHLPEQDELFRATFG